MEVPRARQFTHTLRAPATAGRTRRTRAARCHTIVVEVVVVADRRAAAWPQSCLRSRRAGPCPTAGTARCRRARSSRCPRSRCRCPDPDRRRRPRSRGELGLRVRIARYVPNRHRRSRRAGPPARRDLELPVDVALPTRAASRRSSGSRAPRPEAARRPRRRRRTIEDRAVDRRVLAASTTGPSATPRAASARRRRRCRAHPCSAGRTGTRPRAGRTRARSPATARSSRRADASAITTSTGRRT